MSAEEYGQLLNALLEAERAGAKLLAAYVNELPAHCAQSLEFLNRGQRWVVKRIAAALPRISRPGARAVLQTMLDSHVSNIGICDRLLV